MRIPRLYADNFSHATGEVSLSERNHHYLSRVLRAKPGQMIRLFDGCGRTGEATVKAISKRETTIELLTISDSPDRRLPVTLGLALIKSDRFDWALQKQLSLGSVQFSQSLLNLQIHHRKQIDSKKVESLARNSRECLRTVRKQLASRAS